jgi:hypothetical protein
MLPAAGTQTEEAVSISVETMDREADDWCMACADDRRSHHISPERATFRVVADPVSIERDGGAIYLCPRHALLLWNALGAMLMMREPRLLKMGHGPEFTKAGKELIQ